MRYEEIMEERKKRDAEAGRTQRGRKRPDPTSDLSHNKKSRSAEERERAEREIESWGLEDYCSVVQL